MDPLSITTSVTTLAQFVFGILTILQSVKEGHRQRLKLLNEVNALWKDLINLEVLVDLDGEPKSNRGLAVLKTLEDPAGVFPQLRTALGDLESRLEPKRGIAKLQQNLKWPFTQSDVDRTVQQIYRYRQQLNDALQQENLSLGKEIYNDVVVVKNVALDHEYKAIVDWLSPLDFVERQQAILRSTAAGAGNWFLEFNEYQAWETGKEPILWCVGVPGAGKTVLASVIVRKLLELRKPYLDNQVAVLIIYFSVDDHNSQSPEMITRSLLKQLLQWQPNVPEQIRQLYRQHRTSNASPSKEEFNELLSSLFSHFSMVYAVMDGLDELIMEEQRMIIIETLFNSIQKIKLLITSRPVEKIRQLFHTSSRGSTCNDCNVLLDFYLHVKDINCTSNICPACYNKKYAKKPENGQDIIVEKRLASSIIEVSANSQDIKTYVEWRIDTSHSLQKISARKPGLRQEILSEIVRKADGM